MQQTKFRRGNVRGFAAHFKGHGVTMQFKIWSSDACGQRLLKTPQHRPDAGCKLANAERFGDVIVGAEIEAANSVFLTCAGRQENDWDAGEVSAFPDLAADFKAAMPGNHDVEQKKRRRLLACLWQHFVPGSAESHVESGCLQVMADQIADVRIVFKNNDVLFQMSSSGSA